MRRPAGGCWGRGCSGRAAASVVTYAAVCHAARPSNRVNSVGNKTLPGCQHSDDAHCNQTQLKPTEVGKEHGEYAAGKKNVATEKTAAAASPFWGRLGRRRTRWAAAGAGVVVALVGALCLRWCCSRHGGGATGGNGATAQGSDGGLVEEALDEEKKKRWEELENQVREALKVQEAAAQKLEVTRKARLAAEAAKQQDEAASDESIRSKADEAVKKTTFACEKGLFRVVLYAAPLAVRTLQIYTTLKRRSSAAEARAVQVALEEARQTFVDLAAVLNAQKLMDELVEILDVSEIPSIVMLISRALAPARLFVLESATKASLAKVLIFLLISAAALVTAWEFPCNARTQSDRETRRVVPWRPSDEIRLWLQVDVALGFFVVIVRLWVLQIIRSVQPTRRPNSAEPHRERAEYYLRKGDEAAVALDSLHSSWGYRLATWCLALNFIWMLYALDVVSDIDVHRCSTWVLPYLRIRVTIFLIFALPELAFIVLAILAELAETESFYEVVLRAAEGVDNVLSIGFPATTVLVQGLLLRRREDIARWKLRLGELKHDQLEAAAKAANQKLEETVKEERETEQQLRELREELRREGGGADGGGQQPAKVAHLKYRRKKIPASAKKLFSNVDERASEATSAAARQIMSVEDREVEGPGWLRATLDGRALSYFEDSTSRIMKTIEDSVMQGGGGGGGGAAAPEGASSAAAGAETGGSLGDGPVARGG